MHGGKGRMVWNDAQRWWDYEEPRVITGQHTWVRYLVVVPVERVPLTLAELEACGYLR